MKSEYLVISNHSLGQLMYEVNTYVAKGYKPIGNLTIVQDIQENRSPKVKLTFFQPVFFEAPIKP